MEKDLVSVIVPVYNAESFLEDTIQTVLNQTYTNWEMICINDSSKDNSVEIIEKYVKLDNRIKLINLEKNSGVSIARNTGVNASNGKYIAYLDADDLWEKEKLEKQVKFMQSGNYEFSFTGYEFADENGIANGKIVKIPEKMNYKQALKNTTIWTSTVMLNVEKLGKELIQMPVFKRGEDSATWWKILRQIEYAYGINEVLSYYRRTNTSLSANKIMAIKRTWYIYRKEEKLGFFSSLYNFAWYIFNAVKRRV